MNGYVQPMLPGMDPVMDFINGLIKLSEETGVIVWVGQDPDGFFYPEVFAGFSGDGPIVSLEYDDTRGGYLVERV